MALLILSGCKEEVVSTKAQQVKSCDPIPLVDESKLVKTWGGMTLKLPKFADIRRDPRYGCEKTKSVAIDYLWRDGKLITSRLNGKQPTSWEEYILVRVFLPRGGEKIEDYKEPPLYWRYDGALAHKKISAGILPALVLGKP